jgi:plastocyanin
MDSERTDRIRQRLITGAIACFISAGALAAAEPVIVSQKGREFLPKELTVGKGDTVRFVNDDGQLLHHAYIKSDSFSFDSGDQQPGTSTDVVMTTPGDFMVLCGIHPKMKLRLKVN